MKNFELLYPGVVMNHQVSLDNFPYVVLEENIAEG